MSNGINKSPHGDSKHKHKSAAHKQARDREQNCEVRGDIGEAVGQGLVVWRQPSSNERLADDMLYGAAEIAGEMGRSVRTIYHLSVTCPTFPIFTLGGSRQGGMLCARRSELAAWASATGRTRR